MKADFSARRYVCVTICYLPKFTCVFCPQRFCPFETSCSRDSRFYSLRKTIKRVKKSNSGYRGTQLILLYKSQWPKMVCVKTSGKTDVKLLNTREFNHFCTGFYIIVHFRRTKKVRGEGHRYGF